MPLPNFFCAGALRSGTTYMYEVLRQHPEICISRPKEANHFDREASYHKGNIHYELQFFAHCAKHKVIGDFTPSIMYHDKAPGLIMDLIGPEAKFLFSLRNPIERAYSHYIGGYRDLKETDTFLDALAKEPERIAQGFWYAWSYGYLDRGYYAAQIQRFLDVFDPANMFYVIMELDFGKLAPATFANIMSFLGVERLTLDYEAFRHPRTMQELALAREPIVFEGEGRTITIPEGSLLIEDGKNASWLPNPSPMAVRFVRDHLNNKPPMELDPGLRLELTRKYFLEDIKRLEEIVGRDLSVWYQ